MIRQVARSALIVLVIGWIPFSLLADSYRLRNGELLDGDPISFDARGVVFKKLDGQFTSRASWTNFTDEALRKLGEFPEGKTFVDEYLFEEAEPEEEAAQLEIRPQPVPRLDRLAEKGSLAGLFQSPLTLSLLILIYLANIYAGFEVAIFRNYPPWLVCLAAAILPVIGPIVFLSLPSHVAAAPAPAYELPSEQYLDEGEPVPEAVPVEAHVPAQAQAPAVPKAVIYQRGTTTFNRRFIETKLANFMRVVPAEEDKDMVLVVKSARGDHIGSRISRVMPNEMQLQVTKGGASADVTLPFTEIREIKVCHKDSLAKN